MIRPKMRALKAVAVRVGVGVGVGVAVRAAAVMTAAMLLVCWLSACSRQPADKQTAGATIPAAYPASVPAMAGRSAPDPAVPDPEPSSFVEGICVDVQALNNPLMDQEMKALLHQLMKAVVDRDQGAFARLFPDSSTAEYYADEFTGSARFRFEQVDSGGIERDDEGRTRIPVQGEVLRDGHMDDFFWLVYFKKTVPGGWKLVALD
ncbi:hypothetical protein AWM70_16995 [Paenibacillus yonginensis]|uniref:Uncharacterized protein n=1 Tax=Paenibacillus yonginensis TaxID=1462996 RepID=A0A1B1N3P9_9BACL|nr:hypothetical protein [Paenibacillus yonginensis]ANS76068.1 hypothetical protein AWM70_16995 [Paenibacillus yonginensis]